MLLPTLTTLVHADPPPGDTGTQVTALRGVCRVGPGWSRRVASLPQRGGVEGLRLLNEVGKRMR